jgi:hypothetical protein
VTLDERLHYLGGFFKALPLRFASRRKRIARIREIDLFGWEREVEQHDLDLNDHQIREAAAWGVGARDALRLPALAWDLPYPCDYPFGL